MLIVRLGLSRSADNSGEFENRLLRKMLGPKMYELAANWRKLQNEELIGFNSSPYINRVINPRKMRKVSIWKAWGRKEIHKGLSGER